MHRSLLADAAALRGLAGHLHRAHWQVAGIEAPTPLFERAPKDEATIRHPLPTPAQDVLADYALTGTTLGRHPLSFLCGALTRHRCRRTGELKAWPNGRRVRVAGLMTLRQRPRTASGVIFMTLEDGDGMTSVVVWNELAQRQRSVLLESCLMAVDGTLESKDGVQHLIAQRLEDLTPLLGQLDTRSRDFH